MNREILFRGKRLFIGPISVTTKDEWVYGDRVKDAINTYIYCPCEGHKMVAIAPETVGEYTGLCDKNGKRIFEGDILKFINPEHEVSMYVVLWDDSLLAWRVQYAPSYVNKNYSGFDELCDCAAEMEIVGNIHDNPELLEA